MPSYKLVYFAGRGRGEAIRLAFAYGGIEYEDVRYSGAELAAKRAGGELKPPFGQFPYLEVDGEAIAQSATILRFVAKRAGLYPADDIAAAKAESVVDQCGDISGAAYAAVFNSDAEAKAKALAELMGPEGKLAKMFKGIAAFVKEGQAFLFGDKPSLADLAVYALFDGFSSFGLDLLPCAPALKAVADNVAALPQLAAHFTRRAELEAAGK